MPTRLQIATPDILALFQEKGERVYVRRELEEILHANREFWRLAQSTRFNEFFELLTKKGQLKRWDLPFPHRKEIRYSWGKVPLFSVLMSLRQQCHFSHYTAIWLHDLTEQDPKTIYVNHEQNNRSVGGVLDQERLKTAFSRRPRTTNNIIEIQGFRICLINGMRTDYLGVEERSVLVSDQRVTVRVTDLERTLVDAAVRPFYSGGVSEVLKAYRNAAPQVSTNRLAALLRKINYTYPYHQAVGFYLDRSGGYGSNVIDTFRDKFSYEYDFYLTYHMKGMEYDKKWRLYVPPGL